MYDRASNISTGGMSLAVNGLSNEGRSRVGDYLNDKFQNVGDLENIDNLLAKIKEQQVLLQSQLSEAKAEQKKAEEDCQSHARSLQKRAEEHEVRQDDLDRRLQTLTQSEVSEDAIRKFDQVMVKLRRVDIADGYLKTIQEAEKLDKRARDILESNPEAAVNTYQSLQRLLRGLQEAQILAEGGAPHLLDEIAALTKDLYDHAKAKWSSKLTEVLGKMGWPKKNMNLLGNNTIDWSQYTELLLRLQEPGLLRTEMDTTSLTNQPVVLLPLSVMVQPLALRFAFHFYGEKPTNRLDKPEYFFSHILDLMEQHSDFLNNFLQPILDKRIQQDDRLDLVYTDAVSSFITAMLPMVSAKCLSLLPQLTSQPQLMSHFVHELMSFDDTLQQWWTYSPYAGPLGQWKGLTWDMLTKHNYFDAWLLLEKNFALSRYKKIRDDPDSNKIDFEGLEEYRTKPTRGAIRVNDLLETITDRYRRLASFSQKMKFLIDVQLSIFDDYHSHLHGVFQAYRTSSHTAGRMLSGQSAEEAMGQKGLEALLKIFGSAEYLERKMIDWSDDVFFLELWDELQDRASQNTDGNNQVGRNLSIDEVAAKTSASIRHADEILESEGGALFDETAASYRRLRELSEGEIARLVEVNVRNAIKPFLEVSIWASLSTTTSDIAQLAPTSALDTFDQTTSPLFSLLARVLAVSPLRRIVKKACQTVQTEVLDRLLTRHNFSAAGANQLKRDSVALASMIDRSTKMTGEARKHLTKLNEAITLLSLPIKSSSKTSVADDGADGWGFEEDDLTEQADPITMDSMDEESWGLWQAEKAIFADNASARSALESMGLTELSEVDARNIIRRRIEINS